MTLQQLYLQRARERLDALNPPREAEDRMLTERRLTPAGHFWLAYALAIIVLGWALW